MMPPAKLIFTGIIVPSSILIPIVSAYKKRKYFNENLTVIWYYLLLDGLVNILALALADCHINNLPVLHIFTIIEFTILGYFYLFILTNKTAKGIIKTAILLFPLFCVINLLFFQSVFVFNTNCRPVEALLLTCFSMAYFAQTNDTYNKWSTIPVNWINAGIIIYFSGAMFIFSFSNYTVTHMNKSFYNINLFMWNIHAALLLVMYLFITAGFVKCREQ